MHGLKENNVKCLPHRDERKNKTGKDTMNE